MNTSLLTNLRSVFILTLANLLIITSILAQSPQKMSYQAVVRDGDNELVVNSLIGIQVSILQGSASGTTAYAETQSPTTNENGLFSMEIGNGTATTGDFSTIDWSEGLYFIKTEIDPSGGMDYSITGISQMLSVPYALYAETAGNSCSLSIGDTCEGGIIFYLDGSGCHGLVVKATDEPGNYQWSPLDFNTWALATGIFGGAQNTKKAIFRAGQNNSTCPVASVCDNLISGGYNDWYLPSKDEVDMMYVNLHLQGLGGFDLNHYWSSSEVGHSTAWIQDFGSGLQNFIGKFNYGFNVRAVRAF